MDPELVKGLQQIKKILDDCIFSHQDFDKQKMTLIDVYPVSRPGPALGGVPQSPPAQPQASQPLKGVSDAESRDPQTGWYQFGFRKCYKCPLLECYWTEQGFSPAMYLERNALIRLCLLHDGSQGPSGTPVASTTPKPKVKRQLISPQAAIDIPTVPAEMIDIRGGRTGFGTARPMSGVRTGSGTAGTTAGTTGTAGTGSRTVPPAGTGARTVPLTGNSFDPLPTIPETMSLVAINSGTEGATSTDSDVQILDVCSVPRCRDTSTSMISCGQCKKFIFCGKGCTKKCPCLQQLDEIVSVQSSYGSVVSNNLNRVSNSSSATQTCNYCGS
jgi:hypothetical protein